MRTSQATNQMILGTDVMVMHFRITSSTTQNMLIPGHGA
jgi:hypothetical protein